MMEWVQGLPLLWAIAFLYLVIWCRAGGTYLVGRAARRAADRGRVSKMLHSPGVVRATALINRWGAWVVALSFLTVGFQTAANAAAGLTGMPAKRYLPALAVGGLAWAVIYATVGLVAVVGWFELFLVSPAGAVAVLGLIVALVAVVLRHRRQVRGRMTASAAVVDALVGPSEESAADGAAADGLAASAASEAPAPAVQSSAESSAD